MKRISIIAALLAAGALASGPGAMQAMAAPDPSVGDVIKALTVSPNRTRGSRPVQPGSQTGSQAATTGPGPAGGVPRPAPGALPGTVVEGSGEINLNVLFATGTAELTPAARQTLDVLGQALVSPQLAQARIRIEGHTDTVGSAEANLALSWRRATAAATYLQEKFNIPAGRLEAVGRGKTEPLVPTGDNVDEPRNRRVHVVNISG